MHFPPKKPRVICKNTGNDTQNLDRESSPVQVIQSAKGNVSSPNSIQSGSIQKNHLQSSQLPYKTSNPTLVFLVLYGKLVT